MGGQQRWHVRGTITSGRGLATSRTARDVACINRRFGLRLTPGSLNLVSHEPVWLDPEAALWASESYWYWPARLGDRRIIINRWPGCPAHVFEIFAEVHLRSSLALADGDSIEICGDGQLIDRARSASFKSRLSWYLLWYQRERTYYREGRYYRLTQKPKIRRSLWRASQ